MASAFGVLFKGVKASILHDVDDDSDVDEEQMTLHCVRLQIGATTTTDRKSSAYFYPAIDVLIEEYDIYSILSKSRVPSVCQYLCINFEAAAQAMQVEATPGLWQYLKTLSEILTA